MPRDAPVHEGKWGRRGGYVYQPDLGGGSTKTRKGGAALGGQLISFEKEKLARYRKGLKEGTEAEVLERLPYGSKFRRGRKGGPKCPGGETPFCQRKGDLREGPGRK